MPRRQWGEEVGRGYELASTQWARWLHAKTRSGVEGPGVSMSLAPVAVPSAVKCR